MAQITISPTKNGQNHHHQVDPQITNHQEKTFKSPSIFSAKMKIFGLFCLFFPDMPTTTKEKDKERRKEAHKIYKQNFEHETIKMITESQGLAILCPECREQIPCETFRFHRLSSCKSRDKLLLLRNH